MHYIRRTIASSSILHTALTGVLVLGLGVLGPGCSGSGANNSGGGGNGGGGGGGGGDGGGGGSDTTPPSAPGGLKGDSEDSQIDLTWSAVSASDLDGYNVYRSTSSIEGTSGISPVNGSLVPSESYSDDTVQNGTKYYYVVTAVDTADNESDMSGEISKTPFSEPPGHP